MSDGWKLVKIGDDVFYRCPHCTVMVPTIVPYIVNECPRCKGYIKKLNGSERRK